MENGQLIIIPHSVGVEATDKYLRFTIDLPDNKIITISDDQLKEYAAAKLREGGTKLYNNYIDIVQNAIDSKTFYKLSPKNINTPIDPDEPEELSDKYTTIDYNNIVCTYKYASGDSLCSAGLTSENFGAKVVKNLNINRTGGGTFAGGSPELREYYGDINIRGNGSNTVTIFGEKTKYIQKAVGELNLSGMKSFTLCVGVGGTTRGHWFNRLDLRNVDTSTCTTISILKYCVTPCTIIIGNLSNENGTVSMDSAPTSGRRIVCTTLEPPILRNCKVVNGQNTDVYKSDWIKQGNIEIIYVPRDALDTYDNNVYVTGGQVGITGWSHYGSKGPFKSESRPNGLFEPYNPETEFLPKKEGGENGKTVWLYRAPNRK